MLNLKKTLAKILQEFIGTAWADVPSKTIVRLRYRKKSGVVFVSGYNNEGTHATGWAYIKTGANPYVIEIRNYGYDTSVTNCNGSAIAIPLFDGGIA